MKLKNKIIGMIVFLITTPAFAEKWSINHISNIAKNSECARYSWKNRGKAPASYIAGMGLTFARSLCGAIQEKSSSILMSREMASSTSRDALAHYADHFDRDSLEIRESSVETLRSLYTLGIGLGMRESSGKHCTGWDRAAGADRPSAEAEAGLFQTSYNSMGASPELKKLYADYQSGKNSCLLSQFSAQVSCKDNSILGTGAGAQFQTYLKSCPAFATEYAMMTLRILRKHYGPINRKEAEVKSVCNEMLEDIQDYVEHNPEVICPVLK